MVTIPFDYDEKSAGSVVPICIDDIDSEGNPIPPRLIELGVVPVADLLRKIAARVLNDVWRVSEITEFAIHSLWRTNGKNFGDAPSFRILKRAQMYAEDLRVGGRRARRKADVELFSTTLETLQDQYDLTSHLEAKDTLDRLMDQLERLGMDDIREMVPMMLRDCEAEDLVTRFGKGAQHDLSTVLSGNAEGRGSSRNHAMKILSAMAFKLNTFSAIMSWTDARRVATRSFR